MNGEKSNNVRERAYQLSLSVIRLIGGFPRNGMYFVFQDQLLRSGTSVGANLFEAKAAASKKDFINFYQISLKSCYETIYWLCLLRDSKLISEEKVADLINESHEIRKMISSCLLSLKK